MIESLLGAHIRLLFVFHELAQLFSINMTELFSQATGYVSEQQRSFFSVNLSFCWCRGRQCVADNF